MKKLFFFAATAALALSSCSSDEALTVTPEGAGVNDGAVVFSAYTARTTRGATFGTPVTSTSELAQQGGFGVFAYDQGTKSYTTYSSSSSYPNFMYNQKVESTDDGATWTYDPIKYFNNNEGAKHSFFAYAPYQKAVKSVFALGNAPHIRYSAATENYDLLWAPAIMNIEKPGVEHKLDFNFQHALSKVDIFVAPFVDDVHETGNHTTSTPVLDNNTTVKVRGIKFVGTVASQALLNLENGKWTFEATEESAYEINDEITLDNNYYTAEGKYKTVKENMMVIPTLAGKPVQVQIVYDVITTDPVNSVNNSTITNTITSVEKFNLVQGTAYKFYLDLGLTSVKFKAEVAEWGTAKDNNVDLPNNSKWHPYPFVAVGATDPDALVSLQKVDVMPTSGLDTSKDYYEISTGTLYRPTNATTKGGGKTEGYYSNGQEIYNVTEQGRPCTVSTPMAFVLSDGTYKYWNVTTWTSATMAAKKYVYDLTPNSEGKIHVAETEVGTLTWETPEDTKFYLFPLGAGKYNLYQWRDTGD